MSGPGFLYLELVRHQSFACGSTVDSDVWFRHYAPLVKGTFHDAERRKDVRRNAG